MAHDAIALHFSRYRNIHRRFTSTRCRRRRLWTPRVPRPLRRRACHLA